MSLLAWITIYILISLFHKWVISWGGAEKVEWFFSTNLITVTWTALKWKTDLIRLMFLIDWIIFTILFLIGIIHPDTRETLLFFVWK